MSAIDIHIGTQAPEDRDAELRCYVDGERLEGSRACVPDLSATHNGLTRMVWIRRSLEDLLEGRQIYVADGATLGKAGSKDRARLFFVVDPPLRKADIPWMIAAHEYAGGGLFGEASKMACPSWDLPAGSPVVGGSCPGATAGQTIVPLELRKKANEQVPAEAQGEPALKALPDPGAGPIGQKVRVRETICQVCYAEGGQYASPHVQAGELVRYWWSRQLLQSPEGEDEFVQTVVRAIRGETWRQQERQIDPRTGERVYPVRVHSSGDFFSKAYARAWLRVAAETPEIMYWAPTRTYAAPGWMDIWRELIRQVGIPHGNFAIRPSAYHTGDPAPGPNDYPWPGDYVFPTSGTTSIYGFDDANQELAPVEERIARGEPPSVDPRYDWPCQTYRLVSDEHNCLDAIAPDGQRGCRACWLRPELRVNYTTH